MNSFASSPQVVAHTRSYRSASSRSRRPWSALSQTRSGFTWAGGVPGCWAIQPSGFIRCVE